MYICTYMYPISGHGVAASSRHGVRADRAAGAAASPAAIPADHGLSPQVVHLAERVAKVVVQLDWRRLA